MLQYAVNQQKRQQNNSLTIVIVLYSRFNNSCSRFISSCSRHQMYKLKAVGFNREALK